MYDFLIVGSGPAGGVAAYNLTKGGAKCLLIEAGKFFRKDSFPKNEGDYSAQMFWGGGIEFDTQASIAFLRARCIGGTSIVNQCLLDRFDDIALSQWKDWSGVDFFTAEALSSVYEKVEENLSLERFTRDQFNRNAELFTKGCDECGYDWQFLRRGQSDCALDRGNDCIGCLGGCFRDSKQSTLVTAIQKVENEGLQIESDCLVEELHEKSDCIELICSQKGAQRKFTGAKVILGAGSFGTTQLLLNAGYNKQLKALGSRFSSHPQYMSFGVYDEPVDAHRGAFQTVTCKDPKFRKKGFKLENVYANPISISMLFPRTGTAHQQFMKNFRYMSCLEVAVRDEPNGKIEVDRKGKLKVTKPITDTDKAKRDAGLDAVDNILAKSGAKEVIKSPFYFGLHLMGGCAMGVDGTNSVVNPDFQLHTSDKIYISDSSIFPSAPGINPSLSIMAFAQKMSDQILAK